MASAWRGGPRGPRARRADATYAWDATPISTARLAAEVWAQVQNEDWSLVNGALSGWATRLWNFEKYYQYIGVSGGSGIGYGAPAAAGAALANKKYGRLSINLQNDGDLMYAPGVLWTAAHHRIPILFVMNNNRAYHEEVMHLQRMANRRERCIDRSDIGSSTTLDRLRASSPRAWACTPRADHQSERPGARHRARHRDSEEWGTGADRRDHAGSIKTVPNAQFPTPKGFLGVGSWR